MTSGIYLILGGLAIIGFLPLAVILYKRNRVKRILTTGRQVKATVHEVRTVYQSPRDIVYYSFYLANNTVPYTGKLTTSIGEYKIGDVLDIYYLPEKPQLNTMKGAWGSGFIIGFGIAIAVFVLFAVYKLYQMIEGGQM